MTLTLQNWTSLKARHRRNMTRKNKHKTTHQHSAATPAVSHASRTHHSQHTSDFVYMSTHCGVSRLCAQSHHTAAMDHCCHTAQL
jgi:hypothetical protein